MSTQAHSELHSQWGKVSGSVQQIKTTLLAPFVRAKEAWKGLSSCMDAAVEVSEQQARTEATLARFSSPVTKGRKLDKR